MAEEEATKVESTPQSVTVDSSSQPLDEKPSEKQDLQNAVVKENSTSSALQSMSDSLSTSHKIINCDFL